MNAGLKVRAGETAVAEGRRYQIEKVVNLESVLARDLETGDLQRLLLTQLLPAPPLTTEQNVTMASPDPQPAPEADWQRAHARFAVIRPLLAVDPTHRSGGGAALPSCQSATAASQHRAPSHFAGVTASEATSS